MFVKITTPGPRMNVKLVKAFRDDKGAARQRIVGAEKFTGGLSDHGMPVHANVFVERLWRSVKCQKIYLRFDESVGEARASIDWQFRFRSMQRHDQSLANGTTDYMHYEFADKRRAD